MRAGVAEIEITPPVGVDLTGYVARLGPSVGIHDPLYARALVLNDGHRSGVLIVCDLIGLAPDFIAAVRSEIGHAIDVPPDAIMVACTHTHAGPATLFLRQCGEVDPAYVAGLRPKLVAVAVDAAGAMHEVSIAAGRGALPEGAHNRRGSGAGPDVSVGTAVLRDRDGATVASLLTYGCHPTTLGADNRLVSAEYPGVAVDAMRSAIGGFALFLTGACGNVNPVRRGQFDDVAWLGEQLAREALRVLGTAEAEAPARLVAARETLTLPLAAPPDTVALAEAAHLYRRQLDEAEAAQDAVSVRIARAMLGWTEALLPQVEAGTVPATVEAEVQVIAVGPLVLVGVPGELFSDLGEQIKAAGEGREVFVVGYANGDVGYVPDREAYAVGGYEVDDAYKYYDAPAPLAPEAGEMIVAAAQRLVNR